MQARLGAVVIPTRDILDIIDAVGRACKWNAFYRDLVVNITVFPWLCHIIYNFFSTFLSGFLDIFLPIFGRERGYYYCFYICVV